VVEPYRRVVDLPVAEKRGFEATTYRPWSSKVGLISMVLELLVYCTTVRSMPFEENPISLNLFIPKF
jgi:hypothetical protein